MSAALLPPFVCVARRAIDGDTLACASGPHVRLARVDAPELPGHCHRGRRCAPGDPYASKAALARFIAAGLLWCRPVSASPRGGGAFDRWGRIVARCGVNGRDAGAYLLAGGWAEVWPHD